MKRKVIAIMLCTITCAMCLTACSGTTSNTSSTENTKKVVILDEDDEDKTDNNDKSDKDVESEKDKETEETGKKTDEELQAEYEEWLDEVTNKHGQYEGNTDGENKNGNTNNGESGNTTEEKPVDPYAGLAVAKCHSVTVPKGVNYNYVIDQIVEGTMHYPDTYPCIDNVDLNTPGVYTCAWVQYQPDGTYLPLNYAVFTVTVTEEATPTFYATSHSVSITGLKAVYGEENWSAHVIDNAKDYVFYSGSDSIRAISGIGITEVPTKAGDYKLIWANEAGVQCEQIIHIVDEYKSPYESTKTAPTAN